LKIVCGWCGLTYEADPRTARCAKCSHRASKNLPQKKLILYALFPPAVAVGLIQRMRHYPLSGLQSVGAALVGIVVYSGLYLLIVH